MTNALVSWMASAGSSGKVHPFLLEGYKWYRWYKLRGTPGIEPGPATRYRWSRYHTAPPSPQTDRKGEELLFGLVAKVADVLLPGQLKASIPTHVFGDPDGRKLSPRLALRQALNVRIDQCDG